MELKTNQILRLVLFDVMDDADPRHFAIVPDAGGDIKKTRARIEYGVILGYAKYADILKLLAKTKTMPLDIGQPTYQKEEQQNAR